MVIFMKRIIKWKGVLFLCLFFVGCSRKNSVETTTVPELLDPVNVSVDTHVVTRGEIYELTYFEAEVIPYIEELSFGVGGTVGNVYVKIGDSVTKGQVLAENENHNRLKQLESLYEQLETMQDSNFYHNTMLEYDIKITELSGGDVSALELQLSQNMELQELEEQHLRSQIDELLLEQSKNQVIAPFDGEIVSMRDYLLYQAVSEESPVIAIADTKMVHIATDFINKQDYEKSHRCYVIINGNEYEMEYIPYDPDEIASLLLNDITPKSQFKLIDPNAQVSIGDSALVCMVKNYRENVITIPTNAIYSDGTNKYVYEVVGGTRIRRPITIGVSNSIMVEVLDGIEEGALVYVKD